ncbi:MAG: dihydrodipicolinate synthase family protein [Conexivisphaerales archaeon]
MVSGHRFRGVITAMLTPFDERGEVVYDPIPRFVKYQKEEGVDGLFICGSTGLFPLMNVEERISFSKSVIEEASKYGLLSVVQVGSPSTDTSVRLARQAEKDGANAIAAVPPYYYLLDETSILQYFSSIAKAVSIPVFVYNIPRFTTNAINLAILKRLHDEKLIVGMKDSSKDYLFLASVIQEMPEGFAVFDGIESYLLQALLTGASGTVAALGNVFPRLLVELYSKFTNKDIDGAVQLQKKVTLAKNLTDLYGIPSLYEILREKGLEYGYPRKPFLRVNEERRKEMIQRLKKDKLL